MVEQSKESTDMQAASSRQLLEHSRSNNQIAADATAQETLQGPVMMANSEEVLWSLKGSGHKSDERTNLCLIEGTPQFHGSSPIILQDSNIEDTVNCLNN